MDIADRSTRLVMTLFVAFLFMQFIFQPARAEIFITVDKSTQSMTVARNGQLLYVWPVSTGRVGYATPSGSFTAFRMEEDHYSREWDEAPMPYSIFFTKIGHAIHGSYETKKLGSPVSHGCVRLSPAHAATLFAMVRNDGVTHTKVVLVGSERLALGRRGPEAIRGDRATQRSYNRYTKYPQPQYVQPDYLYSMEPDYYQSLFHGYRRSR
jgi:hypothetical protein